MQQLHMQRRQSAASNNNNNINNMGADNPTPDSENQIIHENQNHDTVDVTQDDLANDMMNLKLNTKSDSNEQEQQLPQQQINNSNEDY
uniref:Uncharacterized protein n=1 Tax=Glossina morsitans morsitans TaxID=37546 RepID=A0A1B0FNP5_GLOMM